MAVGQGALEDLVEEGRGDSRGVRMVPGVLGFLECGRKKMLRGVV